VHWASVYKFQARRLDRFRHGRVLFAGDAAHQVSPFGARGGNAGVQDADNLGWKLAYVIQGRANERLLDSYDAERGLANDEHIRITSRTTNFIAPQGPVARTFRDAVLQLARDHPFARALVNSGRLSTATVHADSALSTMDEAWIGGVAEGAAVANLALDGDYLLDKLHGDFAGFWGLHFATRPLPPFAEPPAPLRILMLEPHGPLAAAFAATPGTFYLLRPDQHVAARWRQPTPALIRAAMTRALGG
jgi:3-(3-hydroxy-phenyl)propionate hydroxylase